MITEDSDAASGNGVAVSYDKCFNEFIEREKAAVDLISSMGNLLYKQGVELVMFRRHLIDQSVSSVLGIHEYARNVIQRPVTVHLTSELARILLDMDIASSKIDIGLLASEWLDEEKNYGSKKEFLTDKLQKLIGKELNPFSPRDVILYGFGRIGRLAARELAKQAGNRQQLRLKAIVVRNTDDKNMKKRAALLRDDSVHGPYDGIVEVNLEKKQLIINGQTVQMIASDEPDGIDYAKYGIHNALVIDNTGVYRDQEGLGRHLKSTGVSRVIMTAPGKGMSNIVYGINHLDLDLKEEKIVSAASCTTNAIVPILKVIEDDFGIKNGHIESIHAYTNDQNLLDNMHKKPRRGRSAPLNMVITSTGAGKAVSLVIPSLTGKLTANAVRVPTPNCSLAIMNLNLNKTTTVEEVNASIRRAALKGPLVNQINYSNDEELVSSDIVGNSCAAVFDSYGTLISPDGNSVVLYTWYDNEFGYTKQVIRLAKCVSKVKRAKYY